MNCAEWRFQLSKVSLKLAVSADMTFGKVRGNVTIETNDLIGLPNVTRRQKQCNHLVADGRVYRQGYKCFDRWQINGWLNCYKVVDGGLIFTEYSSGRTSNVYVRPYQDRIWTYPWDLSDPYAARQRRMMDADLPGSGQGAGKYAFNLEFAIGNETGTEYFGYGYAYPVVSNNLGEFFYMHQTQSTGTISVQAMSAS